MCGCMEKPILAKVVDFSDVVHVIRQFGMVPEDVYTGKKNPKDAA